MEQGRHHKNTKKKKKRRRELSGAKQEKQLLRSLEKRNRRQAKQDRIVMHKDKNAWLRGNQRAADHAQEIERILTGDPVGTRRKIWTCIWAVLALLCLFYGLCVAMLGTGTGFFAVWLAAGVCAALCAAALYLGWWKRLPGPVRRIICYAAIAVVVFFLGVEVLIAGGFTMKPKAGLDGIIVLGAQVYESGPSVVLKMRLDKAVDYLNANAETLCVVSGGKGYNEERTEAAVMAEYLEAQGIDRSRILIENQAVNTKENLRYGRLVLLDAMEEQLDYEGRLQEDVTIGIVTNNFHLYRAMKIAEEQKIKHVTGISAKSSPFFLPNNMLREFLALIKFWILG